VHVYADRAVGSIDDGLRESWQKIKPVKIEALTCDCDYLSECRVAADTGHCFLAMNSAKIFSNVILMIYLVQMIQISGHEARIPLRKGCLI